MAGPESQSDASAVVVAPAAVVQPPDCGQPVLSDDDESRRIAGELGAALRMGFITGPDDPEARFIAQVVHLFKGRVLEY